MKTHGFKTLAAASLLLTSSTEMFGQILFSDNFDAGTSAGSWTAVLSHADAFASFAYDYGAIGIPSAPHSLGGTTIGMNFLANQLAGVQQGISASPNGGSFTGDFTIRFDAWLNSVGPMPVGGSGSTQVGSYGWGTSGASSQWAGSSSSIMFGATGDGNSSFDYRMYRNNALVTTVGAYAAGSLNHDATYYTARFGGESAPAAQLALYPGQTGATLLGAQAWKWRDVVIEKSGTILTWSIDGHLIATGDSAGATLSGDNIFFGAFDINASSSSDANDFLITAIYDNIVVTQVPEPATWVLGLLGGAGLFFILRRRS